MRHDIKSLDCKQLEKLLITFTVQEIADYYKVSLPTMSEFITDKFSKKKLNRPVEKLGSWMESDERKAFRELRPDTWKELKQTNLYKQLMNK